MQHRVARPTIAVFLGMTASGKSALAQAWAEHCQAPYYNTDRVRKELVGLQPTDKRPDGIAQGIYSPALTELTYQTMLDRTRKDIARGEKLVVLDGSYSRQADREQMRSLAQETGACCVFFFCNCSEDVVRQRLALRQQDAAAVSDGRWEIYLHQQQSFEQPDARQEGDCIRLNTEHSVATLLTWLARQAYWLE